MTMNQKSFHSYKEVVMEIIITFMDGSEVKFDSSTVISYKYGDRFFGIITNSSRALYLYNMTTISKVEMRVTKGNYTTVKDYETN